MSGRLTRPKLFRYGQTAADGCQASSPGADVNIGRRIRERRLRRGWVIGEVARKTGLSKAYISQVETGKASPSLHTAQRPAQALEVPLAHLFLEDAFACQVVRRAERPQVSFGAPDKLVS